MNTFSLEILTPETPFFKGNVESLVARGQEGFLGILARHAPLLARLAPGPLRIATEGGEQEFQAGAGLLEVAPGGVTILVDSANPGVDAQQASP